MMIAAFDGIFTAQTIAEANIPQFDQSEIKQLCLLSLDLFDRQETVLYINQPVVIVGDVHGSLEDLARLIKHFGKPPDTKYLFLGDYVDRGDFSVPVLTYLLAIACKYPDSVYLIRGNHEFSHINRVYGFYEEILATGESELTWEYFQEVFYYMPLAAVLYDSIFCVHGGLSPSLVQIRRLEMVDRPVPNYFNDPVIADIVWSDPSDDIEEFSPNPRGSGVLYGPGAIERFLDLNHYQLLIRGHQCTANGVHLFANSMGLTVFSCSDYSITEKNKCGACYVRSLNDIEIYSFTRTEREFLMESAKMCLHPGLLGLHPIKSTPRKSPARRKRAVEDETVPSSFSSIGLSPKPLSGTSSMTSVPSIVKTKRNLAKIQPHGSFSGCHPVQPQAGLKSTNASNKEKSKHSEKRIQLFSDFSQPVFIDLEQSPVKTPIPPVPLRRSKRTNSLETSSSTVKSLYQRPSLFQPMPTNL